MNVTDQWMLERMQQAAASMAASVPQLSQNTEKTEKGDSFKDLMDKAKDQKVEAPKKTEAPDKPEPTKKVQQTEKVDTRKVEVTKNPDGTETKTVPLTETEAAAIAAGYAFLFPPDEDGTVSLGIYVGENAPLNNPLTREILMDHGMGGDKVYAFQAALVEDTGEWTIETTPELVEALERFLEAANDPRSAEDILGELNFDQDGTSFELKAEIKVQTPETEPADDQEEDTGLDAQDLSASQPLFKDVKAAPVKVGENFELDTQQADMDDQLAETIRLAAQQGLKQIEIKLSPENLGALTIKLTQSADGSLQVILHAANNKAANLLTQHLDTLNAALQGYSQESQVQVQVQRNEDSQQAQQQQADPDGHNSQQQQQQQQRQQEESHSQDFVQRLRLGLFGLEETL
ncbi:flagellar hook-length control protein FliK [Pseudoflavonifractor sp. 60]|uniref:flagellar hook-length control protein FliK n=1 Tax=Pseudoflavonifractor sp. 60 TaxID=2304576 RepID=UPI001369DEB6|nr:flagellar hook-length control protein FliK [Pseudoflavonifractor sp. 60]NBI67885.1 flagellar hook-length control protein FliK [Pseudoflavonifractor sp. 60]